MNSSPGAFEYAFAGSFGFALEMPNVAGSLPFLKVVAGTTSSVSATLDGDTVNLLVSPPEFGALYWELMIGYLAEPLNFPGSYEADEVAIYTVNLDQIDIVHEDSGDWYLDINVNGYWRTIFRADSVDDDDPPIPLNIPVSVVRENLTIQVTGYHDVDPFQGTLTTGIWNLGPLAKQVGTQHTVCESRGRTPATDRDPNCTGYESSNWVLYYTVAKGGDVSSILTDRAF
jgi:hypothetical protein